VVVWLAMEGEGGGDVLETAAWPGGLFIWPGEVTKVSEGPGGNI
jgi:hypothetical protein